MGDDGQLQPTYGPQILNDLGMPDEARDENNGFLFPVSLPLSDSGPA